MEYELIYNYAIITSNDNDEFDKSFYKEVIDINNVQFEKTNYSIIFLVHDKCDITPYLELSNTIKNKFDSYVLLFTNEHVEQSSDTLIINIDEIKNIKEYINYLIQSLIMVSFVSVDLADYIEAIKYNKNHGYIKCETTKELMLKDLDEMINLDNISYNKAILNIVASSNISLKEINCIAKAIKSKLPDIDLILTVGLNNYLDDNIIISLVG